MFIKMRYFQDTGDRTINKATVPQETNILVRTTENK